MIEYENLSRANEPFRKEFVESFRSMLKKGWFILGEQVGKFEEEFADYCGVNYCVGVASGFDALMLSLRALRLERNAEVIVPSNSYVATILAVLQVGLKPVLVEPDPATYNIDPDQIEERISRKTRVILPVHLYGKPCSMDRLVALSKRHKLHIIEDCAQAHGAKFGRRMVGSFGRLSAFSFYPTKNLGALGDGGAVVTNDAELAREVRRLRNYGSEKKYDSSVVGVNSRLDEIQAGFLRIKLRKLDRINGHKRSLARVYQSGLNDSVVKPVVRPDEHDVFHIYAIRHPKRDKLRAYLLKHGIKTEIHYPVPPHHQQSVRDLFAGESYPLSEEIHRTILSLPISVFHKRKDISKVIDVLNDFE
ncbi:MAG TPA: DegT/DnrJ/EryC1/StrS family aminotransferase [Bacteroidota bacterium]|nr:DegT/DnrJ/EryC1/StrS family aminotransferase [Bacteroidota bacterium]